MHCMRTLPKRFTHTIATIALSLMFLAPHIATAAETYSEHGPVWMTWYARVDEGKMDEYLSFLSKIYVPKVAAWEKAGLLTGFKVLTAKPQSPDDWNIALIYQYKNMAAMDVQGEDWEEAAKAVQKKFEDDEEVQATLKSYESWRKFIGWSKPVREVIWK